MDDMILPVPMDEGPEPHVDILRFTQNGLNLLAKWAPARQGLLMIFG